MILKFFFASKSRDPSNSTTIQKSKSFPIFSGHIIIIMNRPVLFWISGQALRLCASSSSAPWVARPGFLQAFPRRYFYDWISNPNNPNMMRLYDARLKMVVYEHLRIPLDPNVLPLLEGYMVAAASSGNNNDHPVSYPITWGITNPDNPPPHQKVLAKLISQAVHQYFHQQEQQQHVVHKKSKKPEMETYALHVAMGPMFLPTWSKNKNNDDKLVFQYRALGKSLDDLGHEPTHYYGMAVLARESPAAAASSSSSSSPEAFACFKIPQEDLDLAMLQSISKYLISWTELELQTGLQFFFQWPGVDSHFKTLADQLTQAVIKGHMVNNNNINEPNIFLEHLCHYQNRP